MKKEDLEFLIANLANLCGIPTRLFENNKLVSFNSFVNFYKDPFLLNQSEILSLKQTIGYYTCEDFFYYGFINYLDFKIIIGPFRPIKPSLETLYKMALNLELAKDQINEFIYAMNSIVSMPLESVLQSLSMFDFILNKEKNLSQIF